MRWLNTLTAKNTAKSTAGAVTSIATKKVAQSGKRPSPTLRRWCTARTVPIGLRWVIVGIHATMGFCRQRTPMIFAATAREWTEV